MAQLYNTQTKRYEPVPDNEVRQRVQSGQYLFAANTVVPIRAPDGTKYNVEAQYAAQAFQLGGQYITAEEQREDELKEEYGSGWGNAISAFTLGALSGATITGSNLALVQSGIITKEALDAYKKYQTGAYYGGEVTGTVGSIAATMGLGAAAQVGVRGAATAARAANVVMPAAAVTRGAAAAGRGITEAVLKRAGANVTAGQARGARALGLLAEGTIDAGAFAGAEMLTEAAMGNPNVNAESIVSNVGLSMFLGGAINSIIPGLGTAYTYSKDKTGDLFLATYRNFFGSDVKNPDLAMRQVAEVLMKQENITMEEALRRIDISADGNAFRRDADKEIQVYNDKITAIDESLAEVTALRKDLELAKKEDSVNFNELLIEYHDQIRQRARALENIDAQRAAQLENDAAEFASMSVDAQYKRVTADLRRQEKLAREVKKDLTDKVEFTQDQLKREGKDVNQTAAAHYEHTVKYSTQTLQVLDDLGDEIARTMMGTNRINSLVGKITNGTADGEYATDLVDSLMTTLATRQGEIGSKLTDEVMSQAGDAQAAKKILGQLEKDINKAFEETLGYKYVPKDAKPTAAAASEVDEIIDLTEMVAKAQKSQGKPLPRSAKEAVIPTAKLTPDLDMKLKKVLFPIIDKARKELGDITFSKTGDGALYFNKQSILRQVWDDITRAQKHAAFGDAGTTLGRMNDNWTAYIEARGNLARKFRGSIEKNKKKQIDSGKIRSFLRAMGRNDLSKSNELRAVIDDYTNSVNNIGRHSFELNLHNPELAGRWREAEKGLSGFFDDATEYHNVQRLVNDLVGGNQNPALWHPEALYNDLFHTAESAEAARNALDAHLARTRKDLGPLEEEKERLFREREELAIADAERKAAAAAVDYDNIDFKRSLQGEKEHYDKLLEEARIAHGADRQMIEQELLLQDKAANALRKEAAYTHKEERPAMYRPELPGQQKSMLSELNTQGTTSPIGLMGFMVNGWMGSAAATMGASSLIKRIQNVANGQQRYIAKMDLHDELMRYEDHRRTMLRDAVMNKLDRTMKRKRPSTLSVLIASTASMGDFGDIRNPENASDFQKSASRLRQIESNPEAKAALIEKSMGRLAEVAPQHAEATAMKVSHSLSLITSKLPPEPSQELLRNRRVQHEPPDSELYRFARDFDMVDDYVETLREGFATKALMSHQVDTMKENDPHAYQACVEECLTFIAELEEPMDADTEAVMAVFLGNEISPTRSPAFINTIQPTFAPEQGGQPNPQSAALRDVPQSYMTPSMERLT